ncbi:hypothetical protein AB0K89_05085 [Streptomyces cinnamoneus]|uniref:hypothetical protein n=1 Tax=Streptomyces cinnamoneus TaxID=53446 RepID=UPI003420B0B5
MCEPPCEPSPRSCPAGVMRVRGAAGIRGQPFRPRPPPRHPNTLGGEPDVRNRRTGRSGRGPAPDDGLGDGGVPVAPRTGRHAAGRLGGRPGGAGHEHPADRRSGSPARPLPRCRQWAGAAFNGETYNFRRQATAWGILLAPHETDAHLVLRAWAKLGEACLDGLDGMFALALYDPHAGEAGRLFLARDRLGEKPLYWRLDGGRLAFASEVTTLTGYGQAPLVVPRRCWPPRPRPVSRPPSRASNCWPREPAALRPRLRIAGAHHLVAPGGPRALAERLRAGPGPLLHRPGRASPAASPLGRLCAAAVRRPGLLGPGLPDAPAGLRHRPLPGPGPAG